MTCVWRSRERFAAEDFEGLLRDEIPHGNIRKLNSAIAAGVVAMTMDAPLGEIVQGVGSTKTEVAGISVSSGQRILRTQGASIRSHPPVRTHQESRNSVARNRRFPRRSVALHKAIEDVFAAPGIAASATIPNPSNGRDPNKRTGPVNRRRQPLDMIGGN